MTLTAFVNDARKACAAATSFAALAVGLGLCDSAVAGYVTAGAGAVSTALVYFLENVKPPKATTDFGVHTSGS